LALARMLECCCRTIAIHAMVQLVVASTIAAVARPPGGVTLTAAPRENDSPLLRERDLMAASLPYPRAVASNSVSSGTKGTNSRSRVRERAAAAALCPNRQAGQPA